MRTILLMLWVIDPGPWAVLEPASGQDVDKLFERAEQLFEEARADCEAARAEGSVRKLADAEFKLEHARFKYLLSLDLGTPEMQKLASDRFRSVQHLVRVISDSRVSLQSPPEKSGPLPHPSGSGNSATKRSSIPDPKKQQEVEKLVRDLFKEDYAKKSPADRKALARRLLEQASRSADDPAMAWVLCREAQDLAAQGCDLKTLLEGVQLAAGTFDIDTLGLHVAALGAAGRAAKTPEDAAALAAAYLSLVDDLVAADQFEAADKSVGLALQQARKAGDPSLVSRATARPKELAEARSAYKAARPSMEAIARGSEEGSANLEVGRYLFFSKGRLDLGLRFLAAGSDPTLREFAQREQAPPGQGAELVALADAWWSLGEKEKAVSRRGQMMSRAKAHYEAALLSTEGMVRLKVEKRLQELGRDPVDLLKLIDLKGSVNGEWQLSGQNLVSPKIPGAWIGIGYAPPEEYDVTVVASRKVGTNSLGIRFSVQGRGVHLFVDGSPSGDVSQLDMLDGQAGVNETAHRGRIFTDDKPRTILLSVRKTAFSASVDGRKIIDWRKADFSRFSGEMALRTMVLDSYDSIWVISKAVVTPASSSGAR